jgi:MFS family permease
MWGFSRSILPFCEQERFCRRVMLLTKSIQKLRMTISVPVTNQLSTRLAAVAMTTLFALNGMMLGGYGAALPSLREKLGMDATQIAILLFCTGVAAITSMQIGGRLADAVGARQVTLATVPIIILAMITIGLAPSYPVAILGGVLMGLGNGAMDVGMNAIGVQVEAARGRPIQSESEKTTL